MSLVPRLLLATTLLHGATVLDAQVQLHGRVIEDSSDAAIAAASVTLQSSRGRNLGRQVTDELGRFSFRVEDVQAVRLRVDQVGYQRTVTPVLQMGDYSLYEVEVRLAVAAVPLAPLEIVARSRSRTSASLAGFERRRQTGFGAFIGREEIERRNPMRLSDMLERVPGLWLQPARGSTRRIVYFARSRNCPAEIWVDGFHMNRAVGVRGRSMTESFPIDDVHPGSVEGIEVYQGLSQLPPEFVTPNAHCGVVAVWTRRG